MKFDADNIPLAPRRYPFFYGWLILIMGSLGLLMSCPGQTHGVSPFTDHLIEALGLTRLQLSNAYMFGTIGSALLLTLAGKLYDKHGARVITPIASAMLGIVLVVLHKCDVLSDRIAAALGVTGSTAVPFVVVMLCFFVLRFSGQGVLTMVSRNMMVKWFDRYRGFVTGLIGMVFAPAFSASPMLLNWLVVKYGWRQAWLYLAFATGVIFTIVCILFYRDNPEACGLKPDGPLANRPKKKNVIDDASRRQFTLPEVRRCYSFWTFTGALILFGFYMTGLSFHVSSIFENAGLPRMLGFAIFLPGAIMATVLRPFVGWLCDRIPLKYLLFVLVTGLGIGGLGLSFLGTFTGSHWVMVFGNGLCGATFGSLTAVTWPTFYGRKNLGAISGFNMALLVFGSAVGPSVFGKIFAVSGSYRTAGMLCSAIALGLLIAACRADNPQERLQK